MKRGTGRKLGFYELVAEKLSTDTSDVEDPMARGTELEGGAIAAYEEKYGVKVTQSGEVWVSDENHSIAISPDGELNDETAIEIKCLSSARHLQAYFEKCVPDDYMPQVMQYFIVNEKLQCMNVVFFDPRIAALPVHMIEVLRSDWVDTIENYRKYQVEALAEVKELVAQLTF